MDVLGRALTVVLALLAGFSAAMWVAGAVWAYHDIRARTQDLYVQLFATLLVLLFGPFGAALYLVMRPRESLDEAYLRALQEEAILRELRGGAVDSATSTGLYAINGRSPQLGRDVFVAPGAKLIGDVRVGDGASIWYNVVIRADLAPVIIGPGTNIQDGSVLHVDPGRPLTIGANVTVGHMAVVHACTIEDECLIGIQSTILSGAHVRRHSIVGASALVPENREYPERSVLLGVPAKPTREISPSEIDQLIVERAHEYMDLAANELRTRASDNGVGAAASVRQP